MPACVCGTWKKGDSWVSRRLGRAKGSQTAPTWGTVTAHRSVKSGFRGRGGRGSAEGCNPWPEVCVGAQAEVTQSVCGVRVSARCGRSAESSSRPGSLRTCDPPSKQDADPRPSSSVPPALGRLKSGPTPAAFFLEPCLFSTVSTTAPPGGRIYSPGPRAVPRARAAEAAWPLGWLQ